MGSDGLDLDLYDALAALELAGFPIEEVQVYLASPGGGSSSDQRG